jgi:perosamine synthetase
MREVWIKFSLNKISIPVNTPYFTSRDIESVNTTMSSGWISSSGPAVKEFEDSWSKFCGRKYGVAVANGTAALELVIRALNIGPGDEVIIPSFTIISCASAVVLAGATPVVVDVNLQSGCIDPEIVEKAITVKTKAIMAVHIYGYAAEISKLADIAAQRNLFLIEDAAEMHGGEVSEIDGTWRKIGSFGVASTFSFFINKVITTGEGGMILTDSQVVYEKLLLLRNLGFTQPRYLHSTQGFNYRMTALQASLAIPQIQRIQEILTMKKTIANHYSDSFRIFEQKVTLPNYPKNIKSSYWVYPLICNSEKDRDALVEYLLSKGIETRNFFIGMHRQPILKGKIKLFGDFTNTELLESRGLYLPSGLGLTPNKQNIVIREISKFFRMKQRKIDHFPT